MSGMPGPSSLKVEPQAPPLALLHDLDPDLPASGVDQRVAGQLAGRGHHLGLVDEGEAATSTAAVRTCWRTTTTSRVAVVMGCRLASAAGTSRPARSRRGPAGAMPFSRSRAVRTPPSERPSSTRVIATAGRMPTTTVSASSIREISAMVASMRPMKESTISTAVMSMMHSAGAGRDDLLGQVLLEREHALVLAGRSGWRRAGCPRA